MNILYESTYPRCLDKTVGTESRMVVARDLGEERMENRCLMGAEFQFYNIKGCGGE